LHRNICRNALTNVTVVQRGLWSSSCSKKFFGSDSRSPDHGTGSFIASDQSQPGYAVQCVALDDFVQAAPMPDAIKCDVEGAEVEVLEGATKLLATRLPWIVYERHNEANDAACRRLLQKFGYNFDAIDGYHTLATPARRSGAEAT
jgi:FkbM family methyltransferase